MKIQYQKIKNYSLPLSEYPLFANVPFMLKNFARNVTETAIPGFYRIQCTKSPPHSILWPAGGLLGTVTLPAPSHVRTWVSILLQLWINEASVVLFSQLCRNAGYNFILEIDICLKIVRHILWLLNILNISIKTTF